MVLLEQFHLLKISGPDAKQFLQGQLTCDIEKITPQNSVLAAYCDLKGRMISNFWVFQKDSEYYLVLHKTLLALTQTTLAKYAVFSKVNLQAVTEWIVFGLFNSELKELPIGFHLIPIHQERYLAVGSQALSSTITDSIEWRKKDIEDGLVYLEAATSQLFLPQMINLERWNGLSFTKGCYRGQEIVARTQHLGKLKRHLYRAVIESANVKVGDPVSNSEQQEIGTIVSIVPMNSNQSMVLAVLQTELLEKSLGVHDFRVV